ncbi:hypothetical protein DE146DRAFT_781120 [Phaeosphaeria sp. MPI-PUGE-AT-0046c]|nr:hypothetical protein DE146DRAFT_781120 [Phaeosphaeria sp. MPI-PUGE-AT-0046c]
MALVTLSGLSKQQVMQCLSNLRARTKPGLTSQASDAQNVDSQTTSFVEQFTPFAPCSGETQTMSTDESGMFTFHHVNTGYDLDHLEPRLLNQLEPLEYMTLPLHEPSQQNKRQTQSDSLLPTLSKRKGKLQQTSRYTDTPSELAHSSPSRSSDNGPDITKIYSCTACCCKPFKNAYGWKRHELGVHGHNDIEWVCMMGGDIMLGSKCVLCFEVVHDASHFNTHSIQTSLAKDICDRTFARKDLLKQHVLQMHGVSESFEVPKIWSQEVEPTRIKQLALWCGFCSSTFESVAERMSHVAAHFQNGFSIDAWEAPRDSKTVRYGE